MRRISWIQNPSRRRSGISFYPTADGPICYSAEGHGAVRGKDEWTQVGGDVRERQHIRVESDAERLGHEGAALLDPAPHPGVTHRYLRPQVVIGEGDAILDIGREIVGARSRDDVHLHGHSGAKHDRRAAPDRRVDPLVEVYLVARIEEDPEERIAEPAPDDLRQRTSGLSDPERPIPLGHRLEIRTDQPLDVVTDARGKLRLARDDEACTAVEGAPDAERRGEWIAARDHTVGGAE